MQHSIAMRLLQYSLAGIAFATGCVAADDPASVAPIPTASGSFLGAYTVPVPPELEAAARYPVDHVDWTVAGGIATLHYDLPEGLVGGPLSIELSGPIAAGDSTVTVTGEAGVGTCTAEGSIVTCFEEFAELGALPISMTVVEERAAAEYLGPLADRVAVANLFDAEPLGIVTFDLSTPGVEDLDEDEADEDDD